MGKVLFACVENAGRSQMAEAFARSMGLDAVSCGSRPAARVNPAVVEAMREEGIDLSGAVPKGFDAAPGAEVVVTMGCGDACPWTPGRRIDWELPDPKGRGIEAIRAIRDEIERRVRALAAELNTQKGDVPALKRFVVATRNAGKIREIRALLGDRLEYAFLDEFEELPPFEETGETYEANARIKAVRTSIALGMPALAEDSGLEVDALGGRPGVRSARYSGGDDAANNRMLLEELHGVPDERRTCRYRCAAALADGGRVIAVTEGTCEGVVLEAPRGTGGFGYDPLVFVAAAGRTMAELSTAEKNRLSHRAAAIGAMRKRLEGRAQE